MSQEQYNIPKNLQLWDILQASNDILLHFINIRSFLGASVTEFCCTPVLLNEIYFAVVLLEISTIAASPLKSSSSSDVTSSTCALWLFDASPRFWSRDCIAFDLLPMLNATFCENEPRFPCLECYLSESIVNYSQSIPSNESGCCHGTVMALMGSDGGQTMACLRRLSALLRVEMASHSHSGTQANHIFGFIQ